MADLPVRHEPGRRNNKITLMKNKIEELRYTARTIIQKPGRVLTGLLMSFAGEV